MCEKLYLKQESTCMCVSQGPMGHENTRFGFLIVDITNINSNSQNVSIDDDIANLKPVCEWNHTISVCLLPI